MRAKFAGLFLIFFVSAVALGSVVAQASANDAVVALAEIFPGRNDSYPVGSSDPMTMVHRYIEQKYQGDVASVSAYRFVEAADRLEVDRQVAGTLLSHAALAATKGALSDTGVITRVTAILGALRDQGFVFGFDGYEQNGCAAPTPFLLVLDRPAQTVYGIDLSPCRE